MTFNRTTLPNGLTLLLAPMKDSLAVTVLVMVRAGSKYETKDKNGLSHFLEHMCFKGTLKRPNVKDISLELDKIGAQYNAFTTHEVTGYYAKADARHFDTVLDVVSDIYQNPVFDPAEIEKEKGVIIEEIRMYEDMPQVNVGDVFMATMYGDQPAGWSVIGTMENVKKFTREDFVSYRSAHYVPKATTVVISGNFDPKYAEDAVTKAFADMCDGPKDGKVKVVETQSAPLLGIKKKETDQISIIFGVRTFPANDSRRHTLNVLDAIVGGGMSSRLWLKLREEMGVGYYVRSGSDDFTDHGVFTISAGVDPQRLIEVIRAIVSECKRLTDELVSEEELSKAKEYLIGNTSLSLETSEAVAEFLGTQDMLDEPIETPEGLAHKIRAVTAEEIRDLARDIFQNDRLTLAMIGNVPDETAVREAARF